MCVLVQSADNRGTELNTQTVPKFRFDRGGCLPILKMSMEGAGCTHMTEMFYPAVPPAQAKFSAKKHLAFVVFRPQWIRR